MTKITVTYELATECKCKECGHTDSGKKITHNMVDIYDFVTSIQHSEFDYYCSDVSKTQAIFEVMGALASEKAQFSKKLKEAGKVLIAEFEKAKTEKGWFKEITGIKVEASK